MNTRTYAEQLRELQVKAGTVALLTRMLTPGLVKGLVETVDVEGWIQSARMSPRKRRLRRTLRIGAYAVGLTTAGVAAARLARHRTQPGDRAPEVPAAVS